MTQVTDVKPSTVKIQLYKEFGRIKENGKVVIQTVKDVVDGKSTDTGEKRYARHDLICIVEILNKFNSQLHQIRDFQMWSGISKKVRVLQLGEDDSNEESITIEITIEEAKFLKTYIEEFNEKDGKGVILSSMSLQGIPSIMEQL